MVSYLSLVFIAIFGIFFGVVSFFVYLFTPPSNFPKNIPTIPFYYALLPLFKDVDQAELYRHYMREPLEKYGAVKLFFGGQWNILVRKPTYIAEVFKYENTYAKAGNQIKIPHSLVAEYTGENIISSHGEKWKLYQGVFKPALQADQDSTKLWENSRLLKDMFLSNSKQANGTGIPIYVPCHRVALANLSEVLYDSSFETMQRPDAPLHAIQMKIKPIIFNPIFMNFPFLDHLPLKIRQLGRALNKNFRSTLRTSITKGHNHVCDPNGHKNVACRLIGAHDEGRLTDKDLEDNMVSTFLPSLVLFEGIFKVSATAINATVSMYMVVFAIAPLFGAVASDVGGRKLVYMVGLGSFLVANVLLATLPAHIALLFILRIFQAFGSCIVFSVGAGTVADITEPAKRASALAWFLMGPQLGPVFGPLIGGAFADISRWRWVFGFLALICLPVYCAILFCMPETLRSLVGNGAAVAHQPWFSIPKLRTKPSTDIKGPKIPRPSFRKFLQLLKYPPHLIVSFNGAFQFAGLYGMYISFPTVLKETYNWSTAEVSYAYLAPGISMFFASIIVGRGSDWLRKRAIAKSPDGKVAPERRIAYQIVGFSITAAGKFMYGWFCQSRVIPAAGLIGSALSSVGTSIVFVTSTSFQTECDPAQTASLVALGGLLRNIAAALAAVVMDGLLDKAGVGWTFTIFGVMDILCIPGILLIIFKGAEMRAALKAQG